MRQPLVIANWKLNGSRDLLKAFADYATSQSAESATLPVAQVICPPVIFLAEAVRQYPDMVFGAQHCSEHTSGAFTGETSTGMLQSVGCRYVLVGHSERRALFGETDAQVAAKAKAIQQAGMTPVVCVGETEAERDGNETSAVILKQLEAGLEGVDLAKLVIAYEPVWAIGTGKTASPEQAQEVHALIRSWLQKQNSSVAENMQLLYGGSVKPDNARDLFSQVDIDGGLIGGASLDPHQFAAICKAAQDS